MVDENKHNTATFATSWWIYETFNSPFKQWKTAKLWKNYQKHNCKHLQHCISSFYSIGSRQIYLFWLVDIWATSPIFPLSEGQRNIWVSSIDKFWSQSLKLFKNTWHDPHSTHDSSWNSNCFVLGHKIGVSINMDKQYEPSG